jgi:hypothetical protein
MIKIKPKYILDGCPIQISFDLPVVKTVLVFYGWKSFVRKSNDGIVLYVKKKKPKITVYYWDSSFFKKEKVHLDIKSYKSNNIDDLSHELSGAIEVKKNPILSIFSKQNLSRLKTDLTSVNKKINKPILVSKNLYISNISSKISFEKKISDLSKKNQSINTKTTFDNKEFENFKKQAIHNQQFI